MSLTLFTSGSTKEAKEVSHSWHFMNERVDISLMLRKVRKSVMTKTNGKQVPWDYGSLLGDELILSNK